MILGLDCIRWLFSSASHFIQENVYVSGTELSLVLAPCVPWFTKRLWHFYCFHCSHHCITQCLSSHPHRLHLKIDQGGCLSRNLCWKDWKQINQRLLEVSFRYFSTSKLMLIGTVQLMPYVASGNYCSSLGWPIQLSTLPHLISISVWNHCLRTSIWTLVYVLIIIIHWDLAKSYASKHRTTQLNHVWDWISQLIVQRQILLRISGQATWQLWRQQRPVVKWMGWICSLMDFICCHLRLYGTLGINLDIHVV